MARMLRDPKLTDAALVAPALPADFQPAAHATPRRPRRGRSSPRRPAGPPGPRTCSGRCSIPRNSCSTTDRVRHARSRGARVRFGRQCRVRIALTPVLVALLARRTGPLAFARRRRFARADLRARHQAALRQALHGLPSAHRSASILDISGGSGARFVRGHPGGDGAGEGHRARANRPRASWCAGWPTRTKIAGCRCRTSRCAAAARPDPALDRRRRTAGNARPDGGRDGRQRAAASASRWVRSLDVVCRAMSSLPRAALNAHRREAR